MAVVEEYIKVALSTAISDSMMSSRSSVSLYHTTAGRGFPGEREKKGRKCEQQEGKRKFASEILFAYIMES